MNVQRGDLARIISDAETLRTGAADRIIRVADRDVDGDAGEPFWRYEGPRIYCACPCRQEVESFADSLLRPIRGLEGDDETLAWAGKPAKQDEVVPA